MNAEKFINRYEDLYYIPSPNTKDYYGKLDVSVDDYKEKLLEILGINNLNGSDYSAEEQIEKMLQSSKFNKYSLAWKAGKVAYKDEKLITTRSFEMEKSYTNGYGKPIPKDQFAEYCKAQDKADINNKVENGDWDGAYKAVNAKPATNIGMVYNINTLYFLTAGKAPIYDVFAHKAVKALLFDISPSEVYLGGNPNKNEVDKVIALYKEYMMLLKMVFPNEIKKAENNGMYISRKLDRALWVYGHAIKKYKP